MNWISLILWLLFGLGVHSFLIVPILMEISVDRKQRRELTGELRIKKNGFVIKNFYQNNVGKKEHLMDIPHNICQLYWGIFFGCVPGMIFTCVFYFIYYLAILICFLFGYVIDKKDNNKDFHPYQHYGENDEKKFIAPWKIILPIALLLMVVFYGKTILLATISILTSTIAMYVYLAALGIVAVVWIIFRIKEQEFWSATKEFLKAKKNKVCLKIVPVEPVEIEK